MNPQDRHWSGILGEELVLYTAVEENADHRMCPETDPMGDSMTEP